MSEFFRRMVLNILGSADVSAGSPRATGRLDDGLEKLPSTGGSKTTSCTGSTSSFPGSKMHSVFYLKSVGVAVLILVHSRIAPVAFGSASATEEEQHRRGSPLSGLTAALRQHNASSMLATLEREAERGGRLTPDEASLLLAASWNPAENEISEAMPPTSWGTMRGTASEEKATLRPAAHLYGRLGDTLLAARGVADKARQHLSELLGFKRDGGNILHWWTENGTAAVRAAMTSLFGGGTPSPDENTIKQMRALLAALQEQELKRSAPFTDASSEAEAAQNAAPTPRSGQEVIPRGTQDQDVGMATLPQQVLPRAAPVRDATPTALAGFTAAGDRSTTRNIVPPASQVLERSSIENEQTPKAVFKHERDHSNLPQLSGDAGGRSLEELLHTLAGAFNFGGAPSREALGENGLPSLLPFGLPSMRFSALSILAEGDTLKNWTSLVKMHKQCGQADFTSLAALDVMEKLAVVLASAYKTAKTLLGEQQAVSLIRAAIRQNASFKEQIYSAVRKNMQGGEPAEDAGQHTEDSSPAEEVPTSEKKGQMDVEARLLQEMLMKIIHMPQTFFHRLSQKYCKTLRDWGVEPGEVQRIVKDALILKLPPRGGETQNATLGKRLQPQEWTLEKSLPSPTAGSAIQTL